MIIPTWFLYVGGFSLMILGGLQIVARPRQAGDSIYKRFINIGTLWSMLCISVGVGLLVMALGYWDGPLGPRTPPEQPKPTKHHRR